MTKKEKKIVKLTFSQKLIRQPIIYKMALKYSVMPSIRRAKINEEAGEVVLELDGAEKDVDKGIKFMEKLGVIVEPIVGDIVE